MKQYHFVLVHGACHGAWCWYEVETLLKAAGHQVTSLDMAACGINPKTFNQVNSYEDLYEPLTNFFMESVPVGERVILVGHSYSGIGLSMAIESFPDKIAVAVFVTASMPGPTLSIADIGKEAARRRGGQPRDEMDNDYRYDDGPDKPPTSLSYGPKFLAANLYQLCSPEHLTLATKLVRPVHLYSTKEIMLSNEKYGSVHRAYVVTDDDKIWSKDMQMYMIKNNPPEFVWEIKGSDHMVMLSRSHDLYACLLQIVKYI